jgi:hypothetical protein
VDKHMIKGILAKYSPPLSPGQMDEIAEAVAAECSKTEKRLKAELEKKSKSSRVTRRRG